MASKFQEAIAAALTLTMALPGAAHAQAPEFGDDSSSFARNGECDDMRFSGPGMTATLLIDSDIRHDATDCRTAFNAGRLTYNGGHRQAGGGGGSTTISFGDDSSSWARNGECDDKRFSGAAMATILIDSDINHDATDCRTAYTQGRVTWNGGTTTASTRDSSHIVWGDDSSSWAKNGECDDKRFIGAGMTSTLLIDSDIKHDATDCRRAYEQSRLELR